MRSENCQQERIVPVFWDSVMKKWILVLLLFAGVFVFVGCRTRPERVIAPAYDRPLPVGEYALRKITNPEEKPDFTSACYDLEGLQEALGNSLNYLQKPSSRQFFPINDITHRQAVKSLKVFSRLLHSGLRGRQLDAAIREKFDVYISVGCDNEGTVLFTGYYTPIFDGSLVRNDRFQYPLYKQPDDLVKGSNGKILGRRGLDGQLTGYPPRAVIEQSNMFSGNELVWLKDPLEAYVAHVQGSAKVRLIREVGSVNRESLHERPTTSDEVIGVGYAANNGWEYQSIVKQMVSEGLFLRSTISLSAMTDYFRQHPEQIADYTGRNPRYVFFRRDDGPPRGSLNEPVTAMRTVAMDKSIFPRGCLTFFSTTLPRPVRDAAGKVSNRTYNGFAFDQDAGGAIRAPGRCDIYMGVGDTAGKLAGQIYQEGRLYYLFLK
jgi:membrane-bound lytic murein transglycosylase A